MARFTPPPTPAPRAAHPPLPACSPAFRRSPIPSSTPRSGKTPLPPAAAQVIPAAMPYPCSPKDEIDGVIYFPRLCAKIRLHAAGELPEDLHANLGLGMDQWTCEFLGVDYEALAKVVRDGASDAEALAWAREHGTTRPDCERDWWHAFMTTVGFRDRLEERLGERKAESGLAHRDDLLTMMDYIDADEGRETP